jgi:hypothetical protein
MRLHAPRALSHLQKGVFQFLHAALWSCVRDQGAGLSNRELADRAIEAIVEDFRLITLESYPPVFSHS